jgi:hypothetical protein
MAGQMGTSVGKKPRKPGVMGSSTPPTDATGVPIPQPVIGTPLANDETTRSNITNPSDAAAMAAAGAARTQVPFTPPSYLYKRPNGSLGPYSEVEARKRAANAQNLAHGKPAPFPGYMNPQEREKARSIAVVPAQPWHVEDVKAQNPEVVDGVKQMLWDKATTMSPQEAQDPFWQSVLANPDYVASMMVGRMAHNAVLNAQWLEGQTAPPLHDAVSALIEGSASRQWFNDYHRQRTKEPRWQNS